MTDSNPPFEGSVTTVYAAMEVSGTSWILAVGDPSDTSKAGVHRLAPQDVDGLLGKLGRARERAAASGGAVWVMLVYEASYEGFWLVRRLEGEDLEVVVCDAHYQPYGPIELSYVTAMIGELALNCLLDPPSHSFSRIIVASPDRTAKLGGCLSEAWMSAYRQTHPGVRTVDQAWPTDACVACGSAQSKEAI